MWPPCEDCWYPNEQPMSFGGFRPGPLSILAGFHAVRSTVTLSLRCCSIHASSLTFRRFCRVVGLALCGALQRMMPGHPSVSLSGQYPSVCYQRTSFSANSESADLGFPSSVNQLRGDRSRACTSGDRYRGKTLGLPSGHDSILSFVEPPSFTIRMAWTNLMTSSALLTALL